MTNLPNTLVCTVLACALAILMPLAMAAEDADTSNAQEAAEPAPVTSDPEPPKAPGADGTADKQGSKRGGDIFLPSEEISEDFAVSFPVDI